MAQYRGEKMSGCERNALYSVPPVLTCCAMSAVAANPSLSYLVFEEGKGFQIDPEETIISVAVRQDSPLLEQINTALAGLTEEARLELMAQALERQPGDN